MKGTDVLVIEDDFVIQLFIEKTLNSLGIKSIDEVSSGEKALEILETNTPDLVFIDVGLSGKIDGIETARIIRTRHHIPFVFLSGNTDMVTYTRAKKELPIAFIKKPIDEEALASILKKLFGI